MGPDGLIDRKPPGQPSRLTDAHRAALMARIDEGPIPAVHGVVRWRLVDLIQWLWEEFRITISKQTLSRELRAMDYRKLSARPRHHAKSEAAVSAFKKTSPPVWRRSRDRGRRQAARDLVRRRGPGRAEEQDHAPLGQTRHPPLSPQGPRNASAYIFGAICPAHGKGAGLVLPRCTTEGMTLHLNEIAQAVAPGAHALVLLDQAGWHQSKQACGPGQHHASCRSRPRPPS